MGDDAETGFDDQFDGGMFRTTIHSSRRERPGMWPKSVSEMRANTSYADNGLMIHMPDTAASDQARTRAPTRKPARAQAPTREPMPALRQYYDSARNRWVWIDRAGRIVATK